MQRVYFLQVNITTYRCSSYLQICCLIDYSVSEQEVYFDQSKVNFSKLLIKKIMLQNTHAISKLFIKKNYVTKYICQNKCIKFKEFRYKILARQANSQR